MANNKVSITDSSIQSGVTSDAKKAICEYIWNGFDANAIRVDLFYESNELGYISSFKIKDDGEGISRSKLDATFGKYQDSIKRKTFQWSSQVKGCKGKGRYAFNCFATRADWVTICNEDGNLLRHHISINAGDNDHFNDHSEDSKVIIRGEKTGTVVSFSNVKLNSSFFESDDFIEYLKKEYAVFLKLNESVGKNIYINGKSLDYKTTIAETDSKTINLGNNENDSCKYTFHLTFIRWKEKIKENYCSYFLDENQILHYERTTTLNKKDTGFHHSVCVISSYFNDFKPTKKPTTAFFPNEECEESLLEFPEYKGCSTEKDKLFKCLLEEVKNWIVEKQKEYISDTAGEKLWDRFKSDGTVVVPTSEYGMPLYEDLKNVVKGIYSVQPKVFTNIRKEQAKALVGCLNLLLQTEKREDLLTIIEGVVSMSDEERHRLAGILQATELSYITNTISLLENRIKTVSAIKSMLFDRSLNAKEVPDVQKMISSAFWLFGEQYNIVTEAEPDFQQALESYLNKIRKEKQGVGKSAESVKKIKHPDVNKEMDIFAFRQTKDCKEIENIIVELKRPSVGLGELELSQIKTYMRLIYQEPQFNSTKAKWTFILVGNQLDSSGAIENEYTTNSTWGKRDLVCHVCDNTRNYEIYVKTWSSIFDDFEMRHDFLLKKLQFKREKLSATYSTKEDLHKIVKDSQE